MKSFVRQSTIRIRRFVNKKLNSSFTTKERREGTSIKGPRTQKDLTFKTKRTGEKEKGVRTNPSQISKDY